MIYPHNVFIIQWKILPALVALIWFFLKVCCHVAFEMSFVLKALSHWLQLIQRMYFQILCKFIWLIPRICFEMDLNLWKNHFYIDYIAMVFPKCVSSCGLLYCSYLSNHCQIGSSDIVSPQNVFWIIHSSQLFILILTYCQNNICKSSTSITKNRTQELHKMRFTLSLIRIFSIWIIYHIQSAI